MLDDHRIGAILTGAGDIFRKTEPLVSSAKSAGGRDNITAMLAEIGHHTA